MKFFLTLLMILAVGPITTRASEPPDMISWTIRKGTKGRDTLILWSDGRSEITLLRHGEPRSTNLGWTVSNDGKKSLYRKTNPFSEAETKRKFADALAAGIDRLRTYSSKDVALDGATISIRLQLQGKIIALDIPAFWGESDKDGKGSENHQRFLAIKEILGKIDTNAYDKSQ